MQFGESSFFVPKEAAFTGTGSVRERSRQIFLGCTSPFFNTPKNPKKLPLPPVRVADGEGELCMAQWRRQTVPSIWPTDWQNRSEACTFHLSLMLIIVADVAELADAQD
jgi:hypothetical protein